MLTLLTAVMLTSLSESSLLKTRGFEVIEQIRRDYYIPESKLYAEEIDRSGKRSGPCFNWGTGVWLSALNAAAKLDDKYKPWLKEYADASHVYWNAKGPVPGYDVLPGPKDVDRYYDDNAWMVMALVETYEVLKDPKYLNWADEALKFVLSGWDEKLGGGIYWREAEKTSKNTCSNAPSAAACLAVGKYRRHAELTDWAIKIMRWTNDNLRDPVDGLYWDAKTLEGKIGEMKWTYNTGLAIRSWMTMPRISRLDQGAVTQTIQASQDKWFDADTGAAKDDGKFAHLWLEALLIARPTDTAIVGKVVKALDFLHSKVRNPDGRYGNRWERPAKSLQGKFALIDQASAARAYLFAADHLSH
jgi:hypothetical protein